MKLTGYKIMQVLKELGYQKEYTDDAFDESLWAFNGDNKESPEDAMNKYIKSEASFAVLQDIQDRYNQAVKITQPDGVEISLNTAIKFLGGAKRIEKKWRSAAKKNSYGYGDSHVRDTNPTIEKAHRTITQKDALIYAQKSAKYVSFLREAIQTGNAVVIDFNISDLDASLFD